MLKEPRPFEKEPVLVQVPAFSECFRRATPISHFFYRSFQSQIICERQALMGYQSANLQSSHFSDLNASIPYPVWLQGELPATSLFHLAPVFSRKVP